MHCKLKRTPGIYLVGFMGCGKSTIGRILADRLGWSFADLDDDIEREEVLEISRIFAQRGEEEFRRIEAAALRRRVRIIESGRPLVLALGGGAFAQPANVELVSGNGVTIWLDCPLDVVKSRLARSTHRPLARDSEKLEALYLTRRPAYEQADYCVGVCDAPPATHVDAILNLPIF